MTVIVSCSTRNDDTGQDCSGAKKERPVERQRDYGDSLWQPIGFVEELMAALLVTR